MEDWIPKFQSGVNQIGVKPHLPQKNKR